MARIAGVDLPRDKRVAIGLTYIFGIGQTVASRIIEQAGIDPQQRINSLTEDQVNSLRLSSLGSGSLLPGKMLGQS